MRAPWPLPPPRPRSSCLMPWAIFWYVHAPVCVCRAPCSSDLLSFGWPVQAANLRSRVGHVVADCGPRVVRVCSSGVDALDCVLCDWLVMCFTTGTMASRVFRMPRHQHWWLRLKMAASKLCGMTWMTVRRPWLRALLGCSVDSYVVSPSL